MSACLSWLEIVRAEGGLTETPANGNDESGSESSVPSDAVAHLASCERCAPIAAEMRDARVELLGNDPDRAVALAATRMMAVFQERRAAARRRWLRWVPLALAPVAAGVLLLAARRDSSVASSSEAAPVVAVGESQAGVRSKGAFVIEAYCKRDEKIFRVTDGADFLAGDRLRFAYTTGVPGYLMIFGVDDHGEVFPYYLDGTLASVAVRPASRELLPDSVELDAHHGWERVFALWSPTPLEETPVRAAVAATLSRVGGDLRGAERIDLGGNVEQVSYLLRRP